MSKLLPPMPTGVPPGHSFMNDWYEKLRSIINEVAAGLSWSTLSDTPTTLSGYGITDAQNINQKDDPNGYAGLNAASRTTKGVDTNDDVIIDDGTKGLVLKDTQATPHYWRVTVSNIGVLVITDLGTTKP